MKSFNLYLLAVICFLVFNNLYAQYGLDVQVSTDKQQYHLNDVIEITVTATNYTSDPILLEFSTICQTSYFVDYTQFWDGQTFVICLQVLTGQTIPANGSFTWTHHHDLAQSPLNPGQHIIYGSVDEMYYPMISNGISIEIINSWFPQVFEFENFSDYMWDLPLVQQAHSQGKFHWQTWNDLPGSDEDPLVNLDFSVSNSRMLLVENDDDAVLLLGDKTSGIWDLEFDIYVSDSSVGYFNVLQEFNGDESLWGMQVFFDTAGTGYLNGPGFLKYFDYAYDEWIPVKCHFDLNNDLAFVKVNDQHLRTWQWSDGLSGTSKNQLAAIDFYGWNSCCDAKYYIDDITFDESSEISSRLLGSSSNIYSIENNWLNQIAVNNDLNTVAFIHRNNEVEFGGHNGQLRYDISYDGGLNWQTNQGVINPSSTTLTRAVHPQIALFNPTDNTDPANASLVYFAPYADSAELQGFTYGTFALDQDTLTEHYDTTFDFEYLPGGMLQAENGKYFAVDKKYPYSKLRIFKGEWVNEDVNWEICDSIDLDASGYYLYSWSIAFAPDNTTGWIAAVQKVLNYNRLDEKIIVYLSQTTDGGASWSDPIALDFENFPQITDEIPDPYIASTISNADFDLSVDANGNPHLLIDVFAKEPSGNSYYVSVYHRLFAFRYQESSWIANEICGLQTYGYSLYPDNHWELRNRLHICRNDSADQIFFTWTDSDSTHTVNYLNSLPNFYALGYNVDTDEWTEIQSFTKNTELDEKIFAATVSPIALEGENVYKVPVVFAQLSESGQPTDPVDYFYLNGVNFSMGNCPTAYAGVDATICEGEQYQILDAEASNYSSVVWTGGSGDFDDTTILNPIYTPGSFDVGESVELCMKAMPVEPCNTFEEDCLTLTILPLNENFLGPDTTVCENVDQIALPCSVGSGTWSDYDLVTEGDGYFDGYAPFDCPWAMEYYPGPGDLANGSVEFCLTLFYDFPIPYTESDCIVFYFQHTPDVDAGFDQTICEDQQVLLEGTSENSSGCHWMSTGSGTFDDISSLTATYFPSLEDTDNGEVTLCLICDPLDPCTNTVMDCVDVLIQPKAVVAIEEDDTIICEDQVLNTYNLDILVENQINVLWSTAGDGVFDNPAMIETNYTPGAIDIADGITVLTLTAAPTDPCTTSDSDNVILNIQYLPYVNIIPDDTTICVTECFDFNGLVEAENYSEINWCCGNGIIEPHVLWPIYCPDFLGLQQGFVELSVVVSPISPCSGQGAVDFITIYFQEEVNIDITQSTVICEDDTFTPETYVIENNCGVLWETTGDGTFDAPTLEYPVYTPGPADISNEGVTLKLTGAGCSSCDDLTVEILLLIQPKPAVYAGNDQSICEDQTVILNGEVENSSASFWLTSGTGWFLDASNPNSEYFPSVGDISEGEFTLCLIAEPINPCEAEVMSCLDVSIVVLPLVMAGVDETICEGEVFQTMPFMDGEADSWYWSSNGDGYFDDPEHLEAQYTPGVLDIEEGEVNLCLTVTPMDPCSQNIESCLTLFINKNPIVDAGPDGTICEDMDFCMDDAIAEHCENIQWFSSGDGFFIDENDINTCYLPGPMDIEMGDEVLLSVEGQPQFPCWVYASDDLIFSIVRNPEVMVDGDETICEGDIVQLFGSSIFSSSCSWYTSGTGTFSDPFNDFTTYTPSQEDIQNGSVDFCYDCQPVSPCGELGFDCIYTTIISQPIVDAGNDQYVSNTDSVIVVGYAENFEFTGWETNGDGYFYDPLQLSTTYYPGLNDVENNEVILSLFAMSGEPCNFEVTDDLTVFIGDKQIVNLSEGWNGFSTFLAPFETDLDQFILPIEQQIIIMQNFSQVYWPGLNINTIGDFDFETGYAIKVNDNVDFPVLGFETDMSVFEFEQGWNIMPVYSGCPASVFDFLPEMGANFRLAYEIGGNSVLWPAQGIYSLQSFLPGRAYMVNMFGNDAYTFPNCDEKSQITGNHNQPIENRLINSPWGNVYPLGSCHIIGIPVEIQGTTIQPGDYLGVFNENDVLAGAVEITDQPAVLIANMDDITTEKTDGMLEEEIMAFKLYKKSIGQTENLEVSFDQTFQASDGKFRNKGVSVLKSAEFVSGISPDSKKTSVIIYPNPTEGIINVEIDENLTVTGLDVLDASGNLIISKSISNCSKIDLTNRSAGIYMIKITTSKNVFYKKVVLRD